MRRPGLLILCAMLFAAGGASAQVLMGWGDSPTNGAPWTQVFDCQSNSGSSTLVVSYVVPIDIVGVTGFSVDLQAQPGIGGVNRPSAIGATRSLSFPPYWDLGSHGCRSGALSMRAGFPDAPMADSMLVTDPWQEGLQFVVPSAWHLETVITIGPDMQPETLTVARCGLAGQLGTGASIDLLAGHEYYLATFTFRHDKSASSGACTGCCMPVEFHPTVQLAVGDYSPVYAGGRVGLWQGWENPNCSVAATRTSTWGALKSAYR